MAPTGWARGYVSPEKLKRDNAIIAQMRRAQNLRRRAEIARLSDKDIALLAAEVIVTTVPARGRVIDSDFDNAGLPLDRVRQLKTKAMALARLKEPRIDAMLAAGIAS